MAGFKKNILVFFYLVAVLGFGISSIFIGRTVADRQREILPTETEAADETECSRSCRWENADYCEGDDWCEICQGACKLREANSCGTANIPGEGTVYLCSDCWVPACAESTPTPTPTNTPTPPPGCWGVCTKDADCPQNTTPPLVCPGGTKRCVNPNCPTEQNCTCPPLLCLDLTATPSVQTLKKGDDVEFACKGSSGAGSINHVEFRIQVNDGAWQSLGTAPVTQVGGEYQGVKSYKVPDAGDYRIECRACTSTDETACTNWGLAQ